MALLLATLLALAPVRADGRRNVSEFDANVLVHITEDSLRPVREAMPSINFPPRSQIVNELAAGFRVLPEAAQARVLAQARLVRGNLAALDHAIFSQLLPSEQLLRKEIAAHLPDDMFMPPAPGQAAIIDKALLVDVIARGVLALPRIEQVALIVAIRAERGNVGGILRVALAGLGPGFVKLGQLLGNRPGLLSDDIRREVAKLSSEAPAAPFVDIVDQLDKALERNPAARAQRVRGRRLVDTLFASINSKPLGVGSLGQIHLATLPDGRVVIIKILKPGASRALRRNLDTLTQLVEGRPDAAGFRSIIDSFREVSEAEVDYGLERAATMDLGPIMARLGITVPRIYSALSGDDVLVQEIAVGAPIIDASLSPAERRQLAPRILAAAVFTVLVTGRFHGDLHKGNIFAGHDATGALGLTFIDWGMTLRISIMERIQFVRGLLATALRSEGALMRIYGVPRQHRQRAKALIATEFAKPGNAFSRLQGALVVVQGHGGTLPPNLIHAARTLMLAPGVATQPASEWG
ncbi:MAG: AarF/ABC1/UbiB kinase family protein [Myxococcales bacterium]|nr:AarF/ABC1/UbiB kinase family protein [Myxococcales bacterium]